MSLPDSTLRTFARAGCNAAEISAFTGWRLDWARIRLSRAYRQLGQLLGGRHVTKY